MKFLTQTIILIILGILLSGCSGQRDVDIDSAKKLSVEPVDFIPGSGETTSNNGPLFGLPPGQLINFQVLGGTIDPVGTNLPNDLDGDGILNENETTTSVWVADYPRIEARIATPVTMKIEVRNTQTSETEEIISEITSDDFEETKNKGSEKVHQAEVNERTVQFQDSLSNSSSASGSQSNSNSFEFSVSAKSLLGGGSVSGGGSSSNASSWANSSSYSETTTKWADKPFKNNVDRDAWTVKSDAAAKAARKYRTDKRGKLTGSTQIGPNAGYVRAPLYIKNLTNNMPVRVSNILASLVFETPSGVIVPVQSFRLRNDDFSLFTINVYGGTEFGPYVVELNNLNTVEVEKAIQLGYSPKIYIVDYDLTHVPDSNYRSALLNYTGENLKIVEENAKGRTASIKITGPQMRNSYRVAAFGVTTEDVNNACAIPSAAGASAFPGITLRRALQRIACTMAPNGQTGGIPVIEFHSYVFDFTEIFPDVIPQSMYVRAIKRIGGVETSLPCSTSESTALVCKVKPLSQWSDTELENAGIWMVFSNGQFFSYSEYQFVNQSGNGQVQGWPSGTFDVFGKSGATPITKGVDSTIWAGDAYEIVYLNIADLEGLNQAYGTNPFETGNTMIMNTKWDHDELGEYPFYPEIKSRYLGKAGLGDTLEIIFDLKDTFFLNPDFGQDIDASSNLAFNQFSYNRQKATKKFNIEEAIDFELSMALGGERSDWQNILRPELMPDGSCNNINITKVGNSLNFSQQQFTIQVKLPECHPLVGNDGLVDVYLRPALSNAYRNSIWPQDYREVKKFDSTIHSEAASGAMTLAVKTGIGDVDDVIVASDQLQVESGGSTYSYTINGINPTAYGYEITLSGATTAIHGVGDRVYVDANLSEPGITMQIDRLSDSENFFTAFSAQYLERPLLANNNAVVNCQNGMSPTKCYGYSSGNEFDRVLNNWIGNFSFLNNWSDVFNFESLLKRTLKPLISTIYNGSTYDWKINIEQAQYKSLLENQISINKPAIGNFFNERVHSVSFGNTTLLVYRSAAHEIIGVWLDVESAVPLGQPFIINETAGDTLGPVSIITTGGRALVAWTKGNNNPSTLTIVAKGYDLEQRTPITGEIQIETRNRGGVPKMVVNNAKAMIVWESNSGGPSRGDIWGRFFDFEDMQPIGASEFQINIVDGHEAWLGIVESNNIAFVYWNSEYAPALTYVKGRSYSLETALPLTNEFFLNSTLGLSQGNATCDAFTLRVLCSWHSRHTAGPEITVRARMLMIDTGVAVTDDFILPEYTTWLAQDPNVKMTNQGSLVTFIQKDNNVDVNIYGRWISNVSGLPIGSAFIINDVKTAVQRDPISINVGNAILVAWRSNAPTGNLSNFHLKAKLLTNFGTPNGEPEFTFSADSNYFQSTPYFDFLGTQVFSSWLIDQNTIGINQFVTSPKYGLNNFFTAPLIERNYEARARIIK